jgi:hypothetical protein
VVKVKSVGLRVAHSFWGDQMAAALIGIAVCIVTLFLIVLSTMREIVILRGEVAALSQLITKPPTPTIIGSPLPGSLQAAVTKTPSNGRTNGHASLHVVMFLNDTCGSCTALVEAVHASVIAGKIDPFRLICVVHGRLDDHLAVPLREVGVNVVHDPQGTLTEECGVRRTPMLLSVLDVDGNGVDYVYGGDVKWILGQLQYGAVPDTSTTGQNPRS